MSAFGVRIGVRIGIRMMGLESSISGGFLRELYPIDRHIRAVLMRPRLTLAINRPVVYTSRWSSRISLTTCGVSKYSYFYRDVPE